MAYSDEVLIDTPVIYWRLNEASGNFADASGNSWTATKSGTFTYSVDPPLSVDGTAVTLAGTEYAQASSAFQFSNPDAFTLEAWVKTSLSSNTGGIFEGGSGSVSFRVNGSDGKLQLIRSHVALIATSTASVNDDQWRHVAVTKNGSTVHFYVDGTEGTGTVTNATCENNSNNVGFGADWIASTPDANTFFIGSLDEIAIYDGALSAERIAAHFAAGQEQEPQVLSMQSHVFGHNMW